MLTAFIIVAVYLAIGYVVAHLFDRIAFDALPRWIYFGSVIGWPLLAVAALVISGICYYAAMNEDRDEVME